MVAAELKTRADRIVQAGASVSVGEERIRLLLKNDAFLARAEDLYKRATNVKALYKPLEPPVV